MPQVWAEGSLRYVQAGQVPGSRIWCHIKIIYIGKVISIKHTHTQTHTLREMRGYHTSECSSMGIPLRGAPQMHIWLPTGFTNVQIGQVKWLASFAGGCKCPPHIEQITAVAGFSNVHVFHTNTIRIKSWITNKTRFNEWFMYGSKTYRTIYNRRSHVLSVLSSWVLLGGVLT